MIPDSHDLTALVIRIAYIQQQFFLSGNKPSKRNPYSCRTKYIFVLTEQLHVVLRGIGLGYGKTSDKSPRRVCETRLLSEVLGYLIVKSKAKVTRARSMMRNYWNFALEYINQPGATIGETVSAIGHDICNRVSKR